MHALEQSFCNRIFSFCKENNELVNVISCGFIAAVLYYYHQKNSPITTQEAQHKEPPHNTQEEQAEFEQWKIKRAEKINKKRAKEKERSDRLHDQMRQTRKEYVRLYKVDMSHQEKLYRAERETEKEKKERFRAQKNNAEFRQEQKSERQAYERLGIFQDTDCFGVFELTRSTATIEEVLLRHKRLATSKDNRAGFTDPNNRDLVIKKK